jgi:glycosyltransferase involved in cell wall biosynthesis
LRILQIAPPWFAVPPAGYGGIEWVVAGLADGLVAAGHDVTLLASGGSRTRGQLLTVFDEPPSAELGNPLPDLVHCLAGYRHRDEYDLIHDHSGPIGASLGAVAEGPPVVHTLHGPWTDEIRALYRAMPQRLQLVAISQHQAATAPAGVGIAGVAHNGIPVEQFPFRRELRGTAGYLAFVGRACADKGPDIAVEVARRLGRPLRMLLKVNELAEHAYWEEVVRPLLDGVDVEVELQSSVEDKVAAMAGADAVLMPIRWHEPFGLVMAEALACGTPVVAFERGAAPEIVADGETGFVVQPGDLDGFCAAVERVGAIDPGACRRRVEERFSNEAMVDSYLNVYRRLVDEQGQPLVA